MATRKGGLGRGLDALFADNAIEEMSAQSTARLPIHEIEPNREQPRQEFEETALRELADSIVSHGVLQPLLVRPRKDGGYQLVAGERRWRAARMAGLSEVPVVVRELSDTETMLCALIENLQREDLNPVEEAQGFQTVMQTLSLTQEEAAQALGKSRPAVTNALRLLKLPQEMLQLVREGTLSAGHARALLSVSDVQLQLQIAREIIEKQLSVRQAEAIAANVEKQTEKPEQKPRRREAYFQEVELALTGALGRKVQVITRGKSANGVLSIDFSGKEDLASIARALHALEE